MYFVISFGFSLYVFRMFFNLFVIYIFRYFMMSLFLYGLFR